MKLVYFHSGDQVNFTNYENYKTHSTFSLIKHKLANTSKNKIRKSFICIFHNSVGLHCILRLFTYGTHVSVTR